MNRKKIAVIFGGASPEYEVSLKSAAAVIANMNTRRYEPVLIGITRGGQWLRYYGIAQNVENDTWHTHGNLCVPAIISPSREVGGILEYCRGEYQTMHIDAAFPVLHGRYGEDGTVQGLLELADIPIIGCGTMASALCMDKDRAHRIVSTYGIKTPRGVVVAQGDSDFEILRKARHLDYPLYVKPVKAGSSIGITKIMDKRRLLSAVAVAFEFDDEVIIEEHIEGNEVGCAVVGNETLCVGEVDEMELNDVFLDYAEKYTPKSIVIHLPARVDKEMSERIKNTAAVIYKALGCQGYARVDLFLTPEGTLVFNEINTIPGFTQHSRFPAMMRAAGLSFQDLLERIIELGLKDEKTYIA